MRPECHMSIKTIKTQSYIRIRQVYLFFPNKDFLFLVDVQEYFMNLQYENRRAKQIQTVHSDKICVAIKPQNLSNIYGVIYISMCSKFMLTNTICTYLW